MLNVSKRMLVMLFLAVLVTGLSSRAGDDGWLTDFEKAKKVAAETRRPILIDFTGSDWCGWCIRLDKEVFSQEAFKKYAKENLVLFQADFPRKKEQSEELEKQNRQLASDFGIRGFPTIVLVDETGKEFARTGYQRGGAEKYVEHLKDLLAKKNG
jgi:thioredoxin-related protein